MRGPGRWATLGLVLAFGCASNGSSAYVPLSSPASPSTRAPAKVVLPTLLPGALPGYVVHVTDLNAAMLSAEALDPPSLEALLAGAGFQAGTERSFTARWKRLTQVVARVVRFRSADGAGTYLAWLRAHGTDLLGSAVEVSVPPDLPGAIAFSHAPCGSCTKDTFQYFSAWTRGPYVVTLLVGGPRAGRPAATPIAQQLDEQVRQNG